MKPQRILWDMDGCLSRFMKSVTDYLNVQFIELKWTEADMKMWDFWDHLPNKDIGKAGYDFLNSPGFFRNLEPYEESVKAFKEMVALGHDVAVCTSPLRSRWDESIVEKAEWVEQYLGAEHVANIIFVGDKSQVPGDVIIDDNPRLTVNKKSIEFKNWLIVDHAYNQELPADMMMSPIGHIKNDWSNWQEEFKKLDLI